MYFSSHFAVKHINTIKKLNIFVIIINKYKKTVILCQTMEILSLSSGISCTRLGTNQYVEIEQSISGGRHSDIWTT